MPYRVQKRGSKYCVIKTTDGSTVKCHPTKQQAIKHEQALNINVTKPELKKKVKKKKAGVDTKSLQRRVAAAVWDTAYVNDLPDSAFLFVEPGGKKDGQGKTTPRSKRHLPYKNANGKVDLPHLRNALARIPRMKGVSDAKKKELTSKAQRILKSQGNDKDNATFTQVEEAFAEALTEVSAQDAFAAEIAASHLASKVIDKAKSAAGAAVLVTIPDVPIIEAGVEYQLSTGTVTFTREDL